MMLIRLKRALCPNLTRRAHSAIFQSKEDFYDNEDTLKEKYFKKLEIDETPYTPQKLVNHLDRFIIGQGKAKKAIAIAFRNRWRRRELCEEFRQEIIPKNLLIKGPTGCGKTELARRLALLTNSPFLRVEATKYTEVGYVGKDVNSIVQDKYFSQTKFSKNRRQRVQDQTRAHASQPCRARQVAGTLSVHLGLLADPGRNGRGSPACFFAREEVV